MLMKPPTGGKQYSSRHQQNRQEPKDHSESAINPTFFFLSSHIAIPRMFDSSPIPQTVNHPAKTTS
jgi:hypothetical protein